MKNQLATVNLSTAEAIILQQIHDDIEDDMDSLSSQLGMSRGRVTTLINALKQKGLLIINHDYQGTWVRLSSQGSRLMTYLWPEAQMQGA